MRLFTVNSISYRFFIKSFLFRTENGLKSGSIVIFFHVFAEHYFGKGFIRVSLLIPEFPIIALIRFRCSSPCTTMVLLPFPILRRITNKNYDGDNDPIPCIE